MTPQLRIVDGLRGSTVRKMIVLRHIEHAISCDKLLYIYILTNNT